MFGQKIQVEEPHSSSREVLGDAKGSSELSGKDARIQSRNEPIRGERRRFLDEMLVVELRPFQLLYSSPPMDAMSLSRVTRQHVMDHFDANFPFLFDRLELFQLMRGYADNENNTMAAFGGTAYFFAQGKYSDDQIRDMAWLAFLGENRTAYIGELESEGGMAVVDVTLYTLDGERVSFRDGAIQTGNQTASTTSGNEMEMGGMMSLTLIGLAVGIPVGVLVVVAVGYCLFSVWRHYDLCCCCKLIIKRQVDPTWMNTVEKESQTPNNDRIKQDNKKHEIFEEER